MKRTIQVQLGDAERNVGTLHYDAVGSRERSAFAYHPSWLDAPDGFPLEPGLPLVSGPQFPGPSNVGSVFHAVIADTEPDGWARRVILRDHAKQRQKVRRTGRSPSTAPLNAVDFLLAVDDFSRVGSLRFKDEEGRFCRSAESGRRTIPPLVELCQLLHATRAVEMENETAADLEYLRGRGTSLGGLRPKCCVIDDDGREHYYTEIVDALRVHGADSRADCEQLWRRLVFSILITNVDDHLRNHGFLHADRGLWRLAPAFDINPFPDRVRELKTWPSEGTGPEATIDASLAVIAYFGIQPSRAQAILGEVEAAVGRWRAEGRSLGMTARELDSYVDAFEHPQREAARRAL